MLRAALQLASAGSGSGRLDRDVEGRDGLVRPPRRLGLRRSARAMATRCFWPPESCAGLAAHEIGRQLDRLHQLASLGPGLALRPQPLQPARAPARRYSRTEWLGFSVLSGFWNTIWSLRLEHWPGASTGVSPISAPSSTTLPPVDCSIPRHHFGEGRFAAARFADDRERHAALGAHGRYRSAP